ncbi:MAG: hypothetical protein IJQ86_06360 [Spirochaetia bacterium]|nr:hypothetical protein [Spirochaetia bacterium]
MAVDFSNVKTLFLNGRPVKDLYINGRKVWPPKAVVTFSQNTAYYNISGNSWSSVSMPQTIEVQRGGVIGSANVIVATASYTLSNITYSIQVLKTNWYKDSALTQPFNLDTDIVNEDMTLYAKWTLVGTKVIAYDTSNKYIDVILPKFIKRMYADCRGGGGASDYATKAVGDDYCEVGIYASGSYGTFSYNNTIDTNLVPVTANVSGGETIRLYAGGAAAASYINKSGSRLITGSAGSSGAQVNRRYNIYDVDSDMERKIIDYTTRPGIVQQCWYKNTTKIVSGYSSRGTMRFQYYMNSHPNKNTRYPLYIRISSNSGSSWNIISALKVANVTRVYRDSDENNDDYLSYTKVSFTQYGGQIYSLTTPSGLTTISRNTNGYANAPAGYGQGGPGGYAVRRSSDYTFSVKTGNRGYARIIVAS